jgi:exosortase D (VPLPA-CTERM-specific)
MLAATLGASAPARPHRGYWAVLVFLALIVPAASFGGALENLLFRWDKQEEYSHGYLIPFVAAWLLWTRKSAIASQIGRPSWTGVLLIAGAIALNVIGELSAIFILAQIGFVLSLMGLALAVGGWSLLRIVLVPTTFLFFAIPLPYFIDAALSLRLQLLSSELAGVFIRSLGIPVFIDGNIIDLGVYKLQVVDACSGLRYLFPFLSLGFLAAYLFQAPVWQRVLVFASTVPITILMNSLRIGMVGVLTNLYDKNMAEGALHLFEGWIIFLACSLLLVGEMYLLARLFQKKRFFDVFRAPEIAPGGAPALEEHRSVALVPVAAGVALLALGGWFTWQVAMREEILPERARFVSFPTAIGSWRGRASTMEPQTEHALGLEDYVLTDYARDDGKAVNLYVAYYASQRGGSSPHSPLVCVPGGGWQITDLQRTDFNEGATAFPVNRVVIERGTTKQLVYYWFEQRGRRVANEWVSKWYLLVDAVTMNRSDGALVRLTTALYPGETEADADRRIKGLIPELSPSLSAYLPARDLQHTKRAHLPGARGT